MSRKKRTTQEFIQDSILIHGEKYDYSKSIYNKRKDYLIIICPVHGEIKQKACGHLLGKGCDKCAHRKLDLKRTKSVEDFINESNKVHDNFYSYENTEYINWKTKVKINCPKHGEFLQIPNNHLRGHGCDKCRLKISKPEVEIIDYIKNHYRGTILTNDRNVLKPKELDIYLPQLNIAFEFNGEYWHSLNKNKNHREDKTFNCILKGITLFHIEYSEWKKNKSKVLEDIRNIITEY